jgi:hypothetical protein
MAYQDKFELDYVSLKGERKTVTISRKLGRGGKIDIWGGGQPNKLTYPVVSKKQWVIDKFQSIRGSALEIDITSQNGYSDRNLQSFQILDVFTEDNRLFKVEEKLNGASNWTGYLLTDLSEEPYEQKPYQVSGVSADCLKDLEGYKYVNSTGKAYWGYQTVLEVIINCLNTLAFELPICVSCEMYAIYPDLVTPSGTIVNNDGMDKTKSPLEQAYVHTQRFLDKNDEPLSCYEVLQMVLEPFGLICFQANNRWNIVELRLLGKPTLYRRIYSHIFLEFGIFYPEKFAVLIGEETVDLKKEINTDEIRVIANSAKTYTLPSVRQTSVKIDFGSTKNLVRSWNFNEPDEYALMPVGNTINWWSLGLTALDLTVVSTNDYLNSKTVQLNTTCSLSDAIPADTFFIASYGARVRTGDKLSLSLWFSTSGQQFCKDIKVAIMIDDQKGNTTDYGNQYSSAMVWYDAETSTWVTDAKVFRVEGKKRSEVDFTNEPVKNQVEVNLPMVDLPLFNETYLKIFLFRTIYDEDYYNATIALPAFVTYEKVKFDYLVDDDKDVVAERYQCEQQPNKFGKILDPKTINFGAVQGDRYHAQFMRKGVDSSGGLLALTSVAFYPWVYWQRKGDTLPKRPLGHLLAMQELANYYKPSYVFEGTLYGTGFDYTNTFRLKQRPQTGNLIPVGMTFNRRMDECGVTLAQLMIEDPLHTFTRWAVDGKNNEIKLETTYFCGVSMDTSDDLDIYGVFQNGRTPTGYTLAMWWRDRNAAPPYDWKIKRMLDLVDVVDVSAYLLKYYDFELSQVGAYEVTLHNNDTEEELRCFKVRTDIIRITTFAQSCEGNFRHFEITLSTAVVTNNVRITFTALDSNEVFLEFDALSLTANQFGFTLTTDIPTDYYVIKVMDLATEQYAEIVRELSSCVARRNIFDPTRFDSTKFA